MRRLMIIGISAILSAVAVGIGMLMVDVLGSEGAIGSLPTATSVEASPTATATATPQATASAEPSPTRAPASATPIPAATPAEVTVEPRATTNPNTSSAAPTMVAAPAPAQDVIEYTVQQGDLLYTIAEEHGVTIEEILAINEISNPESLTVGQVIRIPKR